MQVYLAAWLFPTSFGSMPLLFRGQFLIGKLAECLFHPLLKEDISEFSVGFGRPHLCSVSREGWWAWSTQTQSCPLLLEKSLEGDANPT